MIRTEAVYWKADTPENFSKENFSVFIAMSMSLKDFDFYGIPIHEYPGLVKVKTRPCVVGDVQRELSYLNGFHQFSSMHAHFKYFFEPKIAKNLSLLMQCGDIGVLLCSADLADLLSPW